MQFTRPFWLICGVLGRLKAWAPRLLAKECEITDLLHGNVVKFRFALPRLDPDSFREVLESNGRTVTRKPTVQDIPCPTLVCLFHMFDLYDIDYVHFHLVTES